MQLRGQKIFVREFSWDHRICEPVYDTLQIWTYRQEGSELTFCDVSDWEQNLGVLNKFGFQDFYGSDYVECDV